MASEVRYLPRPGVIRAFMEDSRMSQRDLARLSGGAFKKSTVGNLVKPDVGQAVSRSTALALAGIFQRDVETFFVREVRQMENQIPQQVT